MTEDPINAQYLSDALESERRRLATRVEGDLINQMTLILAQINAYEGSGQGGLPMSVVGQLMQGLLQQTYDLISDLNPSALETLGLIPALEQFAKQQRRARGLDVTLHAAQHPERLPPVLELALFRTVQALTDRAQQANASKVMLTLHRSTEAITLTLADNGVYAAAPTLPLLDAILNAINGTLNTAESRYGGTEITLTIPIETPVDLTEREMDVIRLLADGLTNREIALRLDVRPRTIKFHLDNIYSKLNVNTRTEAAIYALRHGWTTTNA